MRAIVRSLTASGFLAGALGLLSLSCAPEAPAPAPAAPAAPAPAEADPGRPALKPEVLSRVREATVFVQVGGRGGAPGAAGPAAKEGAELVEGSGSGFFIAPDGRVATCWHVVSPMKDFGEVSLLVKSEEFQVIVRSGARDQKVLPARLLAVDTAADLAVLKVEAEGCTWLALGDSGALLETAPLWVAGFPLGKVFSVLQRGPELSINSGHVSSLRHNDLGRLQSVQFDAAVVPGNSGGPVVSPDGRVQGIATAAIGTSRVNFAVPVDRLKKLLEECPPDCKVGKDCVVEVSSDPAGAEVYLDSVLVGQTPLAARADGGYRRVVVALAGRRSWARSLSLYDGRKIRAELQPLAVTALKVLPRGAEPAGGGTALKRGAAIFEESFADPKAAEAWKQDTGGGETRTWYVQDGRLHQFSDDGVLHAVFAGEAGWTDYCFSAKVLIRENQKDGRAGLIFRATEDGFALFRLHRETSKVQLAYHMGGPFGWQVFEERTLGFKVKGDTWYRMEVQALGDQIVCLLDGQVVLEATARQPAGGRVGFYSVDAQASFDDAAVSKVEAGERKPGQEATLRSFWLSDQFAEDSGYWRALAKGAAAPPWAVLHGGCLLPGEAAAEALNLLTKYDLYDFAVNCPVTCRSGTVGLAFRHDGARSYVFAVDPAEGRARLLLLDGAEKKELAAAEKPAAVRRALVRAAGRSGPAAEPEGESALPPGGFFSLFVIAQGGRIRAGVNGTVLIETTDESLSHGRLGFYADKAKGLFHRLDANSGAP